jgi:hypothetical protein
VPLKVPFRSIDAGEPLIAIFWVDLDPSASQVEKNDSLFDARPVADDSRPLDEQVRVVTFNWDAASSPPGCRTVTMQLAHESTFPVQPNAGVFQPGRLPPTNVNDIAQVTWWFDVRDPGDPSQPICWGGP